MKALLTLSILVAAMGMMTSCSDKQQKQNVKYQVYRAIRIYNSSDSTAILGDPEPVYITGPDTLVYGPGDTIMVTSKGLVDKSEEPDHEVVLGVCKGTYPLGTAD